MSGRFLLVFLVDDVEEEEEEAGLFSHSSGRWAPKLSLKFQQSLRDDNIFIESFFL